MLYYNMHSPAFLNTSRHYYIVIKIHQLMSTFAGECDGTGSIISSINELTTIL